MLKQRRAGYSRCLVLCVCLHLPPANVDLKRFLNQVKLEIKLEEELRRPGRSQTTFLPIIIIIFIIISLKNLYNTQFIGPHAR